MKLRFFIVAIAATLALHSNAQTVEEQNALRAGISWLNDHPEFPSRATTYLHKVPVGGGFWSIRGPLSAQACLNYATIFAIAGMNSEAIEWLKAGQDHNPGFQDLMERYPAFCIDYLKGFRKQAVAAFGYGLYGEYLKSCLAAIRQHNPDPKDAPDE